MPRRGNQNPLQNLIGENMSENVNIETTLDTMKLEEETKTPQQRKAIKKQEELKLSPQEANKKKLEYMRDRDREKVKGIFHYNESPGGVLEFFFRAYAGDAIEKYSLTDGQIYELPRGVVRHLRENGWYPVHENAVDKDGKPIVRISKKTHRFSFEKYDDLYDADDMQLDKQIITVSKI